MKKFSEQYINQHSILKLFRVGFEFEFFCDKLNFYKLLEEMNNYFSPVQVYGMKKYHSSLEPTSKTWKIEPDLSGGSNMIELVTGPMGFYEAKIQLVNILKFIDKWGYTTDKSSIHINISFIEDCELSISQINILKMIIRSNEEEIYQLFPSRQHNN
jgi:hypothetical protein